MLAAAGFVLFFGSLRHVQLGRMDGLGLLSVLPHRALAGVTLLALAFVFGLTLRKVHPVLLGAALVGLVICLDGVTSFIEPAARFATSYQIAGYVQYISATGKAAPDLAAYFSWPGFFALISFIRGAAGMHSVLELMRFWPMLIDLLTLPPFFLLMRNLRISWRAKWLAGFLLVVGNWVGQDYFSPQSLNYVLYLTFLAILVNWFTDPRLSRGAQERPGGLNRVHRFVFGRLEPGEVGPRPASTGQRVFLLAVLIGILLVSVMSHQLTPFYMTGACLALVLIRRCQLSGLWILCAVLVATWLSFAAVDYWSGHLSNIFGGVGNLGGNLTSSVGGRLAGSTATHLLTLHARVGVAGVIVALAVLGLLRRRFRGFDDRLLIALFILPMLTVGLQSYGGEIALRIYLFLLPPACVLAACFFFPNPAAKARASWRLFPVLALCAVIFPVSFILVRYGNEAFERVPPESWPPPTGSTSMTRTGSGCSGSARQPRSTLRRRCPGPTRTSAGCCTSRCRRRGIRPRSRTCGTSCTTPARARTWWKAGPRTPTCSRRPVTRLAGKTRSGSSSAPSPRSEWCSPTATR